MKPTPNLYIDKIGHRVQSGDVPTIPWIKVGEPKPATEAVIMTSRFRLRGYRHVLPFFLAAMRVLDQVRAAEGALGVSLVAHPLRKEFFTLSAWRDKEALEAMVRSEPHRSVMQRQRAMMAESEFRFWNLPTDSLPPTWPDAQQQLTQPA
jgi:heme-degrading monooxygenase HmoA